jgi:guanine deaminase
MKYLFVILFLTTRVYADKKIIRGDFLHFLSSPDKDLKSYQYLRDGALYINNGKIVSLTRFEEVKKNKQIKIIDHRGKLILPGFIDTHIHYPQTDMIASYGEQLLEWLNKYTFPTEKMFQSKKHSEAVAKFFIEELIRNGTTTALIFATIHPTSVDAIFSEARKRKMRIISGKTLMDRNAPSYLLDTAKSAYNDSKMLIKKWHKKERLLYAVTPRFAPTSTPEQLKSAGKLIAEFPDVYMHTHLSENKKEIEWVKALFPESKNYLDVYNSFGLVNDKSIFAHSIHLKQDEIKVLKEKKASISFCPTSNLFLGSGLFDYNKMKSNKIPIGLGTDVGAGTSFSILKTLGEAYKIAQMKGQKLPTLEAFYLATLGGAKALKVSKYIGNFQKGKEADFVVIDLNATPLFKRRVANTKTLEEKLFVLLTLGDDRNIKHTYVYGNKLK